MTTKQIVHARTIAVNVINSYVLVLYDVFANRICDLHLTIASVRLLVDHTEANHNTIT